jgi:O-antigen ligase
LLFLYMFRERLGVVRAVQIAVGSVVVLSGAAAVVTNYSEFGNMLDRMDTLSEFEGGVPDTRQVVWPEAIDRIPDRLWLGHGPLLLQEAGIARSGREPHPEQLVMAYPHSLYLHLLLSVGIVGSACMLYFLFSTVLRVYSGALKGSFGDSYQRGLLMVGFLILAGIMVDQVKIEFLRHGTIDYVHFVLALFGVFLGLADRSLEAAQAGGDREVDATRVGVARPEAWTAASSSLVDATGGGRTRRAAGGHGAIGDEGRVTERVRLKW